MLVKPNADECLSLQSERTTLPKSLQSDNDLKSLQGNMSLPTEFAGSCLELKPLARHKYTEPVDVVKPVSIGRIEEVNTVGICLTS